MISQATVNDVIETLHVWQEEYDTPKHQVEHLLDLLAMVKGNASFAESIKVIYLAYHECTVDPE